MEVGPARAGAQSTNGKNGQGRNSERVEDAAVSQGGFAVEMLAKLFETKLYAERGRVDVRGYLEKCTPLIEGDTEKRCLRKAIWARFLAQKTLEALNLDPSPPISGDLMLGS